MADSGTQCDDISKIFETTGVDKKYRYFNQPIEQIPNYDANAAQILVHAPSCGLMWQTAFECLPVVTCLRLEDGELKIERRKIVVLQDFAIPEETSSSCPNIALSECSPGGGSGGGSGGETTPTPP